MKKRVAGIISIIMCGAIFISGCGRAGMFIRKKTVDDEKISTEAQADGSEKVAASIQRKEIKDQSFEVELKPLGKVKFISYEPDTNDGKEPYADATFEIEPESDDKVISLEGMSENNIRDDEYFNKVEAVAFRDYNGDGYDDIIIICSYTKNQNNSSSGQSEARLYSGSSKGKFTLERKLSDDTNAALSEITISSVLGFVGADRIQGTNANYEWKQAYIDWITKDSNIDAREGYKLIYIDDNDVPEVAVIGKSEAAGCIILTYSDGTVYDTQLSRLGFSYIERGGLLCNSEGNMGHYYDIVYKMSNGKLDKIAEGAYGDDEAKGVQFDSNGEPIYVYEWEGTSATKEEYYKQLNEVYDTTKAKDGYDYKDIDSHADIINKINNY